MNRLSLMFGFSIMLAACVAAQSGLTFEVASIKPRTVRGPVSVRIDAARAEFSGCTLRDIICRAYSVRPFQVTAPDWVSIEQFDIVGKLPARSSPAQVPEMLQSLLRNRFKLSSHLESRAFQVYVLLVGSRGVKLTPRPAHPDALTASQSGPAMTLATYAGYLSAAVDRPVFDQTGLVGEYLLSPRPIKEAMMRRLNSDLHADGASARPDEATDPGGEVFDLVKSLGLKLEPRKLALPALVIDRIERLPAEN